MSKLFQKIAVGAGVVGMTIGSALAAVPEEVTTSIAATKADSVTVATAMIGIHAALLTFVFIRRVMH